MWRMIVMFYALILAFLIGLITGAWTERYHARKVKLLKDSIDSYKKMCGDDESSL